MTHKNILLITTFLFFTAPLLRAQENDSIAGFRYSDTISVNKPHHNKTVKTLGIVIPATMIGYGILSIESDWLKELDYSTKNELLEDKSMWYNSWDNYVQFSPAVAAFGMKLSGVQSVHKLSDMCILYALSNALDAGIVYTTKHVTGRKRPDGSNSHSFPSGHTATAFVAAEFLHQEYKDQSAWISVGGYGIATLIGISRVYNNKHWVSDVVAGAGIGILSTKLVYWSYPYLQKTFGKKDQKFQTVIFPVYDNGSLSLGLSCRF